MKVWFRITAAATLFGIAGCTVAPLDRTAISASARIGERVSVAPDWPAGGLERADVIDMREPLTLPDALLVAFTRNPEIRRQYARLGIAHGDLRDAARIANPTLSLAWLRPQGGGPNETTQGLSTSFSDLLLLPVRRRLSAAEFRRVELAVASALVALAHDVETAWHQEVGALQVAAIRSMIADAAQVEAELAQRYFDAGNVSRLQLDLQQAAAARTRIEALHAQSDAASSRERLANLLGVAAHEPWRTIDRLAGPPDLPLPREELIRLALSRRLDLASARDEVALLEDALGVTRSWRMLGSMEAGVEREHESGGRETRGPTLSLELPLFNQGQGAVERAEARLLDARARADWLGLAVANEVTGAIERLAIARETSERYRRDLLPATTSAVAGLQERVNYMLENPFALFQAKREQYAVWQAYFESVRDYWIAHTALRSATGGLLPGDDRELPPTIGPDAIGTGDESPPKENAMHEHHGDAP